MEMKEKFERRVVERKVIFINRIIKIIEREENSHRETNQFLFQQTGVRMVNVDYFKVKKEKVVFKKNQ